MYARRASGLGIAPAVVALALPLARKLVGVLFGPSEGDRLQEESRAGNVVAWWRLKAMVNDQLPAKGTINGRPFDAKALSREESEALVATVGPEALQTDHGGGFLDSPTRNRVFTLYADGTGDWLDQQSAALLHPAAAGAVLGGLTGKLLLAGVAGWIVFSLFRR